MKRFFNIFLIIYNIYIIHMDQTVSIITSGKSAICCIKKWTIIVDALNYNNILWKRKSVLIIIYLHNIYSI